MSDEVTIEQLQPQESKDKLFISLFILGFLGGLWLSLQSVGHLLSFNVQTLMITAVVFTITSLNYVAKGKPSDVQIKYSALCLIPIGLRYLFNMPIFSALTASQASVEVTQSTQTQLYFMLQIIALWILVALSEEAFRATMLNFAEVVMRWKDREFNLAWKILFANAVWILFHFVQRPFDPIAYKWYIVWLFISGLVMTYVLVKAGLGSAILLHMLVNITA
jgi:hypothetical protein